ncbi:MAG: hypothetical protein ACFBWO_18720 [Paracoccaceae bacterium]
MNAIVGFALRKLQEGGSLDHMFDGVQGFTKLEADVAGSEYFRMDASPVMVDFRDRTFRLQFIGEHAETWAPMLLDQVVRTVDPEARWKVILPSGDRAHEGCFSVNGSAVRIGLRNERVPIGPRPDTTSDGTVCVLRDMNTAFVEAWHR